MTRNIPGVMDYSKFTLPAKPSFHDMNQDEQWRAVHSLANDGHSDHEIARLCQLHVEQVRRVLATVEHDEAAAAHARAWVRP